MTDGAETVEAEAEPRPAHRGRPRTVPDLARRQAGLAGHVFIHTHIEKTAGSALIHGLANILGWVDTLDTRPPGAPRAEDLPRETRDRIRLYTGHFHYGQHRHFRQRSLYVCAVREPLLRAVSYWRYIVKRPAHPQFPAVGHLGFAAALDRWIEDGHAIVRNGQCRTVTGRAPRERLTLDEVERQLDEAYFLVIPQKGVGRAIGHFRRALGLPDAALEQVNVGDGPEIEVDHATRRRYRELSELDLALFARARDRFPERLEAAADYLADLAAARD